MPDIRLQDYTAKIKDLMQVDRLDEAIAHGQHILRHYPKHVETYCLLGEACLEKRLFREAIEFFQRTLSADPENLIARVGLGVIYDEQGALPEAIWQMERAFELAPGNTEVRQELLRLYAQRDGREKPRLKLTRGALGRLCSRNGLYERSINEFRAVLRQDPDLPDIRVAFAEALWREGRRLEAVEICQSLLDDLPFCLKANLILCEIWLSGGHEDAGEERLELARALDPEGLIAQEMMGKDSPQPVEEVVIPELEITPDLLEAAAIPEGVVMPVPIVPEERLEEVEWTTEEEVEEFAEPWDVEEEMPDWLQEIAITEEEEPVPQPEDEVPSEEVVIDEQVPDWLQELVEEEPAPAAEAMEEIPEWLREIEMEDLEEETPPVAEALEEEPAAAAEIPEWLREIEMPEEEEEAIAPPAAEVVDSVPELLGESEADEEAPPPEAEELVEEAPISAEEAEIPASLLALVTAGILSQADLESALEEMSPEELEAQHAEAVPDWLEDMIGEESPPVAEGLIAGKLGEEVPDWLRESEDAQAEELPPPVAEAEEEVVEPLAETEVKEIEPLEEMPAAEVEPIAEAPVEEFAPDEELPDWLRELGIPAAEEEVAPPPVAEEAVEEIPAEEVEPVAAAPVEEFAPDEELPDWLRELGVPAAEEEVAPPPAVEEAVEEIPAEEIEPVAEALVEEIPAEEVEPVAEAPAEEAAPEEELPDWLREPEVPVAEEEVILDEELPDWLRELGMPTAEEEVAPPPAVEEAVEEIPAEEIEPVAEAPVEEVKPVSDVPASLLALVEAGILDESDVGMAMAEMSPEDLEAQRAEAVPDWLQYLIDEEAASAAEELAPAQAEPAIPPLEAEEVEEEIELVAEVPTEEAAPPPAVEELAEEVEPVAEMPESLQALVEAGILDESDLEAALAGMSPEELQARYTEAVPDWLQDLIGEEAVPPPPPEAPAEEIPSFEEEVLPEAEVAAEEALVVEEEVAPPPVEEPVEAAPPIEAVAAPPSAPVEEVEVAEEPAPPVEEAPTEEATPVEEAAPPTELEMVPPHERVEIEEVAAPPPVPVEEVEVAEEPAPPVEEAPAEEAPPVEEAAPPTELEMVAPYERVEIEEEAAPPARLNELLARLKAKPRDYAARLELARLYSTERDWNTALDHYEKLIAARNSLPAVIDDLNSLTQEEVDQARVYQMLGDAHMQSDHLDQALEMYRLARQALVQR